MTEIIIILIIHKIEPVFCQLVSKPNYVSLSRKKVEWAMLMTETKGHSRGSRHVCLCELCSFLRWLLKAEEELKVKPRRESILIPCTSQAGKELATIPRRDLLFFQLQRPSSIKFIRIKNSGIISINHKPSMIKGIRGPNSLSILRKWG